MELKNVIPFLLQGAYRVHAGAKNIGYIFRIKAKYIFLPPIG
jgi:hypothetical protein